MTSIKDTEDSAVKFVKLARNILLSVAAIFILLYCLHFFSYAYIFIIVAQLLIGIICICLVAAAFVIAIITLREWKLRKFLEPVMSHYGLEYLGGINKKDTLHYYNMFRFIKRHWLFPFELLGTYENEEIRFFQMGNLAKNHSVVMITMDKYESKFEHIKITPNTILNIGKGFSLEWIEFNKEFVSKLDNPRQALEVLSPTFMETLVDMKRAYGNIEIECFRDDDYQTKILVIAYPGNIFDLWRVTTKKVEQSTTEFIDFLNMAVRLKKSI